MMDLFGQDSPKLSPKLQDLQELIDKFELKPHPEGGYYSESYRSPLIIPPQVLPQTFTGARASSTAIYFLLPQGERSRLHRLNSDEIWHFYLGSPLRIVEISPQGNLIETTLGSDWKSGTSFQYCVKAGHWFGSYPLPHPQWNFSFVGCTVSPGFDFADFELAEKDSFYRAFPHLQNSRETQLDCLL